ncbi:hypothetical protein IWQ61_002752 [Dispira simplex]|nr:hypothetical protein IWQ61_002752 [Dispira simplex]
MPYTIAPHDLTLLFPFLIRNQPCCISGNPFGSHVDTTFASGLELVQPPDKSGSIAAKSDAERAHAAILNIKEGQMVYDIVYTFLLKYAIPPYHHCRLYDLVQSCFAANERQLYRRQISEGVMTCHPQFLVDRYMYNTLKYFQKSEKDPFPEAYRSLATCHLAKLFDVMLEIEECNRRVLEILSTEWDSAYPTSNSPLMRPKAVGPSTGLPLFHLLVNLAHSLEERQDMQRTVFSIISVIHRWDYRQWVLNVYDTYLKYNSSNPRDTTQKKTAESGDSSEPIGDATELTYRVLCHALDPFVKTRNVTERDSSVSTPEIAHGYIPLDINQIRNWFVQEYAESIELLQGMGFDETPAVTALQFTKGHADDAVDIILAQSNVDSFCQSRAMEAQEAMVQLYAQHMGSASENTLDTSTSTSANSTDTVSLWSGNVTKIACDSGSSSSSNLLISPISNKRGKMSKEDAMLSTSLSGDEQDVMKSLVLRGGKETTSAQEVEIMSHHIQKLKRWLPSSQVTTLVEKLRQIASIWITLMHRRLEKERRLPDLLIDRTRAQELLDTCLGLNPRVKLAEPTSESTAVRSRSISSLTSDQSSLVSANDMSLALSQAVEEELRQMSFVDNFSVSLGRPIPVTHHLRLNATQLSTLLRPPIHPAQRTAVWAQTAASLYAARLHALVVLLTPDDWLLSKPATAMGIAHEGKDAYCGYGWVDTVNEALFNRCNASVDYHFPSVRDQLTQIRTQLHGNNAELRPVPDVTQRSAECKALTLILDTMSRYGITSISLPLYLLPTVKHLKEDKTPLPKEQYLGKRSEMVLKCIKGHLTTSAQTHLLGRTLDPNTMFDSSFGPNSDANLSKTVSERLMHGHTRSRSANATAPRSTQRGHLGEGTGNGTGRTVRSRAGTGSRHAQPTQGRTFQFLVPANVTEMEFNRFRSDILNVFRVH